MAGLLGALVTSISNVFRAKTTEDLPWKGERRRSPRYRSTFALVHYKPEDDEERARFAASDHRRVGGELKTREELGLSEAEWAEVGEEACIGCEMCAKICPSDVITVKRAGRHEDPTNEGKKRSYCADFTLDLNACIVCELCVQVCPTDAILMLKVQEPPGYSREDLLLTMDRLYDNEKLDQNYWASGSVLVGMQAPPKAPRTRRPAKKK